MLTVEEAFDLTLIEEGQFLLGEDFITETLGFGMDKISKVFYKSIKEYSRRKPIQETTVITGGENGNFLMPVGTLAVRAIRYDILDDYPRTMFPDFGQRNYEYDKHTRRLRTFPPMSSLRVSYDREYRLTDSAQLETSEYSVSYEESITLRLSATPKKGTLKVTRNGKSMEEKGIEDVDTLDENGNRIKSKRIILKGELGEGYYDRKTRVVEVFFNTEEDGDVVATFTPSYLVCPELDTGEYVYMMLFKSYILEAIASLRSQSTQLELHNIDLTNDDLYGRVRILKALVDQKLRNTIDFGAMSPI
jgi:hypothetical protein